MRDHSELIARFLAAFKSANPSTSTPEVKQGRPGWIEIRHGWATEKCRPNALIERCIRLEARAAARSIHDA